MGANTSSGLDTNRSARMPAVFFGHGSPLNALASNSYTNAWRALGQTLPKPQAILMISAHWYTRDTAVTAMQRPRTIHDFSGFPDELNDFAYPAPGAPALAQRVHNLLDTSVHVRLDNDWGLDHGTWSVLCHVYPRADVPVVQLSLDRTRPARWHYELAKSLAPLRDEGVLIAGSGNLVHNLRAYDWSQSGIAPHDWAARFESAARTRMLNDDLDALIHYESLGPDAMLSVPTPDHYLPLLYILALRQPGEPLTFPVEGTDGGSISMLSVAVGL